MFIHKNSLSIHNSDLFPGFLGSGVLGSLCYCSLKKWAYPNLHKARASCIFVLSVHACKALSQRYQGARWSSEGKSFIGYRNEHNFLSCNVIPGYHKFSFLSLASFAQKV